MPAAAPTTESLTSLLTSFTTSITSALDALPADDEALKAFLPPQHGISLLDTKNELFLEYVRHLVFLMLLKLRNLKEGAVRGPEEEPEELQQEVVKKLVELRVYLEKGVRPLEGRLKYQVDKVVRAAEDAEQAKHAQAQHKQTHKKARKAPKASDDSDSGSGSGSASDSSSASEASDHEEEADPTAAAISDLSFRPNPTAFRRPTTTTTTTNPRARRASSDDDDENKSKKDTIYRPPRITATAMPDPAHAHRDKPDRPQKSATLDEFIASELSTAPLAEPSIGSTIVAGGRHMKSARERADEAERAAYEESNLVRLPKLGKKEAAKASARNRMGYGGEEWRGLGEGLDRIEKLTKGKAGSGKGALERSRKRGRDTIDSGRGTGTEGGRLGDRFEMKKRRLERKGKF